MPIGEIAGEALGGLFRFVGRILLELVFEMIVQGAGRFILGTLGSMRASSEMACALAGLSFWAGVAAAGYVVYRHVAG